MKRITVQDCRDIRDKFNKYCDTAEQHEFAILAMIDTKMIITIEAIEAAGKVENQKDIRAMFRVILRAIGEDPTEYEEEEDE